MNPYKACDFHEFEFEDFSTFEEAKRWCDEKSEAIIKEMGIDNVTEMDEIFVVKVVGENCYTDDLGYHIQKVCDS